MVCLSAWFWALFVEVEITPREVKTGGFFSMTILCFLNTRWWCLFVLRITRPCPVAQTCLKLAMLLPQTPEYWGAPSYPVSWVCVCCCMFIVHGTGLHKHIFILVSNVLWVPPPVYSHPPPFQPPPVSPVCSYGQFCYLVIRTTFASYMTLYICLKFRTSKEIS